MNETGTMFEQWLRDTATNHDTPIGIGLLVERTRIKRQQLQTLVDSSKAGMFNLESSVERETRYRYAVKDETIERYEQYRIQTAPEEFRDGTGELVIEVPSTENPPPELPENIDGITANCLIAVQEGEQSGLGRLRSARVAGLDAEKEQLVEFLTQSLSDWGLRDEVGMLLSGPPGTGKTELVKEVCEELYGDIPVTISGPEVLSRWVGESEATLRRTFKRARESDVPVLYIDEVDAIGSARADSTQDYTAQVVSQLLVLLDGIEAKERRTELAADAQPLKVIASTNAESVLDPALTRPGRLGDSTARFDRPDTSQRRAILHHYLERIHANDGPLSDFLEGFVNGSGTAPVTLVDGTEGYTGADIEHVVLLAARSVKRSADAELTLDHLERALKTTDSLPTDAADETRESTLGALTLVLERLVDQFEQQSRDSDGASESTG